MVDGAYFGTTFPHLFLLVYTNLVPIAGNVGGGATTTTTTTTTTSGAKNADRYTPTIFGFRIHDITKQTRPAPDDLLLVSQQRRQLLGVKEDHMDVASSDE